MVFTNYELDRMIGEAISVFVGQEFLGFDNSSNTPSAIDTTMDSEIKRFEVDSVTLNTSDGTYTVFVKIPLLELDGETINRIASFDAISNGDMGIIEDLPSSYAVDTVHEIRVQLTVSASALDSETTFLTTEAGENLITESGVSLIL